MAENKSKSNKVPKLSEVIKSTLSNIKEITDATKVIVGSVEDLAKLIPDDFDQKIQNIDTILISGIDDLNIFIVKFNHIKLQNINDKLLSTICDIFSKINTILLNILNINKNIVLIKTLDLDTYKNIIKNITDIMMLLADAKNIKVFIMFNLSSKALITGFKSLIVIFSSIKLLLNFGIGINLFKSIKWQWFSNALAGITKSMLLLIAITPLVILFLIISPIIFVGLKLFMILIRYIIRSITRNLKFLTIKQYLSLKMKISMINSLMGDILLLMLKLILITPIIILFIVLSPVIQLGGIILTTIIWGIMKLLSLVSIRFVLNSIGKIALISLMFLGMGLLLLGIISISIKLIEDYNKILTFFLIITLTISAVILLGGLFSLAGPLIAASIIGLGSILIVISLFTLIALQLFIIQNLNINPDSIKNVLLSIKETILSILNILFDDSKEPETSKSKGPLNTMIGFFGKILSFSAGVLTMISAVPLLVMTVISVGVILLIATELRIIQALKLDNKLICKNVSLVLATVNFIINSLFAKPKKLDDSTSNNKSWFKNVIDNGVNWFSNKLSPIIDSILAVGILALSVISVTLILVMAGQLRLLQIIDFQPDKIKENVKTVIDTAKYVIYMLFYTSPDYQESESKSWWSNVITWASENIPGFSIARAIGQIIEGILAIGILALSTVSISLLLLMASELRLLQAMDLDAKTIKDRATNVLSTAKIIISSLWDGTYDVPQNKKSWDRKLFEFCLPDSLVMLSDALSNIGILAPLMISVKMFGMMVESLSVISKYESMDTNKIKTVVNTILSDVKIVISQINDSEITINNKFNKKIDIIKNLFEAINELGKDVNVETHNTLTKNAGELIKTFTDKEFKIDNYTKFTDNTIKLIDKIDNSKLENLQTAHNMFKEMKEFSESISGNFDGLAESLNERIAPLLEELKGLIKKIPESVDKSASTISTSMYNTTSIANGTANTSTMTQQVQSENPTMSKEEVNRMVDQRMNQQAQSVNKGIEMKLEELIDVLQNYSNPIPVRMS